MRKACRLAVTGASLVAGARAGPQLQALVLQSAVQAESKPWAPAVRSIASSAKGGRDRPRDPVATAVVPNRREDESQSLRQSKALNRAIIDASKEPSALIQVIELHGHEFSSVNVATALTSMSRCRELRRLAAGGSGECGAGPGGATRRPLQQRLERATRLLGTRIFRGVHGYEPQALVNSACGLVKLGASPGNGNGLYRDVLAAMERRAVRTLRDFNPQNLSNIVWAYAKAKQPAPSLFGAAQEHIIASLPSFTSQNIANAAWAYATAKHPAPVLFRALASEAARRIDDFSPQGLANAAWAFAAANQGDNRLSRPLMQLVAHSALEHHGLHAFTNQGLANLSWGLAKVGAGCGSPLGALEEGLPASKRTGGHAVPGDRLEVGKSAAWATEAALPDDGFFQSLAAELVARGVPRLSDAELAMTAWAFCEARFYCPRLLADITREASRRADRISSESLANIAKAAAVLRAPGLERLLSSVRARVSRCMDKFKVQELATISYAIAISGSLDRTFVEEILCAINRGCSPQEKADSDGEEGSFQGIGLESSCAAFQSLMAVNFSRKHPREISSQPCPSQHSEAAEAPLSGSKDNGGHMLSFCRVPDELAAHLERTWRTAATQTVESRTHKAVMSAMTRLGLHFYAEEAIADGLLIADVLVKLDSGRTVAVEVDGPSHFTSSHPLRELGPTILRQRLLLSCVDAVISIPFFEWDAVSGMPRAEEEYIERRLSVALV